MTKQARADWEGAKVLATQREIGIGDIRKIDGGWVVIDDPAAGDEAIKAGVRMGLTLAAKEHARMVRELKDMVGMSLPGVRALEELAQSIEKGESSEP